MRKRTQIPAHTSVTLGQHFSAFITRQLKSGRFETTSEVIRAGLRLLEMEQRKLAATSEALEEGEASGFDDAYTLERLLGELDCPPS